LDLAILAFDLTWRAPGPIQQLVEGHLLATADATEIAKVWAYASLRLLDWAIRQEPDADGYERFACPARGAYPHLCCPLQPASAERAVGKIPVLLAPADPPKVCTQSAITIAPDIGARHRDGGVKCPLARNVADERWEVD
jgi:hypothetical protein